MLQSPRNCSARKGSMSVRSREAGRRQSVSLLPISLLPRCSHTDTHFPEFCLIWKKERWQEGSSSSCKLTLYSHRTIVPNSGAGPFLGLTLLWNLAWLQTNGVRIFTTFRFAFVDRQAIGRMFPAKIRIDGATFKFTHLFYWILTLPALTAGCK